MSLHDYLLFMASSIVLVLVTGPDMAYMLTRTVAQGRRCGEHGRPRDQLPARTCILPQPSAGLSALILASTTAFTVVKWVGAAYLCYLGLRALLSRNPMTTLTGSEMSGRSLRAVFWQGFWSDVLNPKVAIFYVALLPQFIDAQAGNATLQLVLLGVTSNMVAVVINLGLVAGVTNATSSKCHRTSVFLPKMPSQP